MVGRAWSAWLVCLALCCGAMACDDAARVEFVCQKFCTCENASPTVADLCTEQCVQDLAGVQIPDECADCVALNECRDIEAACEQPCQVGVPRMSFVDEESYDEAID